jgi:hypothetical protein
MKINEFTQLDEFFTRASRITRAFDSYVKKNNLQPTHQAFLDYMNSKDMDSKGVADMLNKAGLDVSTGSTSTSQPKTTGATGPTGAEIGKNFIDGKKVNPLPNTDATTSQKPGAGANQAVGKQTAKQPQATKAQPKTAKASSLNKYFQNFSSTMKQTSDKGQKIALAKELVNIVADRGGQDSQSAVALLRRSGTLDNNFKQAAMNALKKGTRMESVFVEQFLQVLKENDISLKDIGLSMTLTEDSAYIVTLLEQNLSKQDIAKLSKQAVQDNPGGAAAMASGLRKGYKLGRNPLKTTGGAIADKFKGAADAYDKAAGAEPNDSDGGSTQDTRAGVNTLRTELGLENPAMAVKALEKLQAGKPLSNKNELNAVKPIVNAVSKALQSTQGRARLKQLIKTLS